MGVRRSVDISEIFEVGELFVLVRPWVGMTKVKRWPTMSVIIIIIIQLGITINVMS